MNHPMSTSPVATLSRRALMRLGALAAIAGVVGPRPAAAAWRHLLFDLGPGGEGGDWSSAGDLNGAGQVLFTWATAIDPDRNLIEDPHPCIWEAGAVRDLTELGFSHVSGIAADGSVLGGAPGQALRLRPGMDDAEPLPGFGVTFAFDGAISPSGLITGTVDGLPVLLDGETLTDLPLPAGFEFVSPEAINDSGQVAGVARVTRTADAGQQAVIVDRDGRTNVLPPAPAADTSAANAINAAGLVAGGPGRFGMHDQTARGRAFRHDPATGETIDLGAPEDYANSYATGMNAAGQVVGVGWEATPDLPFRTAWLWDEAAGMTDLNTLIPVEAGWLLSDAHDINDAGWITGQGAFMGQRRGFVLVPVETA
jgi:probable HAF family extracellular repeat protein